MLTIIIPGIEHFNEETQEFMTVDDVEVELEHSLVTLSKWESIYQKPFLSNDVKTEEEVLGYLKAMVMTPNISPEVFSRLTEGNIAAINTYIDSKMTATWFHEDKNAARSREIITSELIYYWMIIFKIPIVCENWHLNRLFTLIRICNVKNAKPKKMSASEQAARNRELNAQRRAQLGTSG